MNIYCRIYRENFKEWKNRTVNKKLFYKKNYFPAKYFSGKLHDYLKKKEKLVKFRKFNER